MQAKLQKEAGNGIVAVTSAYLLWGILPLYWKLLASVPSQVIVCHRIVWAFLFTLFLLRKGSALAGLARNPNRKTILAVSASTALLLAANWLIYIWAVNNGHIVEASLGYFINPLVAVLLGVLFLRESLRPGQWLAMATALGGVLVLTLAHGTFPWIGLSLALTFATYSLLRKTAALHSLDGLVLETGLMTLPALLALFLLPETTSFSAPIRQLLLLAGSGPITALPLLLFVYGAQRVTMTLLGLMQYLAPSLQFLIGILVYREPLPAGKLAGFLLIWTALALYTGEHFLSRNRRRLDHASRL